MLKTTLCGITLQSPYILGSGPLSYGAKGMIRAHQAGAGAVVTKTIRDIPADNPYPHMAAVAPQSMVNAEKWSDSTGQQWVSVEIPQAKAAGVVVIASIGHTVQEAQHWVPEVDAAGADMIELVSYEEETMIPMIQAARALTDKPVIAKLSPNWKNPVTCAELAVQAGADAITAMDSIGPVLSIDITTAKPVVGGAGGTGWLTGSAIKPVILHYVSQIAQKVEVPIIGLGGVMLAQDAVEMLMAGAQVVGICTAPILKGIEYIGVLNQKLENLLKELGYNSLGQVSGAALPHLHIEEDHVDKIFSYDPLLCTGCMRCVKVCAYESRTLTEGIMALDTETCRSCGLCASVCSPKALTFETQSL